MAPRASGSGRGRGSTAFEQNVFRLDVTMHNAALVSVAERGSDLVSEANRLTYR